VWYQDRRPLTAADLHEPPPATDLTQKPVRDMEEEPQGIRAGSSAKIDQLVHLLNLTPPTEKSLVFSQFTSFLDKVMFCAGDSYSRANDI
jgi:SWI/SNF-related matrix-associated actin-dependent regulator of chromatin subfamily A3